MEKITTPPKTNMDTQNDAIFEAGDTFKKNIILGIYVRFRGGTSPFTFHMSEIHKPSCKPRHLHMMATSRLLTSQKYPTIPVDRQLVPSN